MSGKTLLWQIYAPALLLLILVLFLIGWRGWNLLSNTDPKFLVSVLEKRAGEMVSDVPRAICQGLEWEPWELPPEPTSQAPGLLGRLRELLGRRD